MLRAGTGFTSAWHKNRNHEIVTAPHLEDLFQMCDTHLTKVRKFLIIAGPVNIDTWID